MCMENEDMESYHFLPDAFNKLLLTPTQTSIIHTEGWSDLTRIQPVRAWSRQLNELTTAIHEMRGTSQKYHQRGVGLILFET